MPATAAVRKLTFAYSAVLALWALLQLPVVARFDWFAFGDQGSNLTLAALLERRLLPAYDFGFTYGLLSALISEFWFGLFGKTPAAFFTGSSLCLAAAAWGLARAALALNLNRTGTVFLGISIPFALTVLPPSLTHSLEMALLCHVIALYAMGKRAGALALATLCVFVKPAMAYFAGLLILLDMAVRHLSSPASAGTRLAAFWRDVRPATLTAVGLAAVLAAFYGRGPLISTQLGQVARANYEARQNGFFFGAGRTFWDPVDKTAGYYLSTTAGFWLTASALLLIAAGHAACRIAGRRSSPQDQVLLGLAAMHVFFVCFLYSHHNSWYYYSYILALGVSLLSLLGISRSVHAALACLLLIGLSGSARSAILFWRDARPSTATAGLWASAAQREEWTRIRTAARKGPVVVITMAGAAHLLCPGISVPDRWFADKGISTDREWESMRMHVRSADLLVSPKVLDDAWLLTHPMLAGEVDKYEPYWEGRYFRVFRKKNRRGPLGDPAGSEEVISSTSRTGWFGPH